ncbi:MAG TPA: type II secretion system minor pseudopilin GspJ [Burkholderiales bacterium]|nr:type II secretion system minor pseudopilin GspJ [Burkholderiales bacterium]
MKLKISRAARESGFTLIELLIALLILSILALMSYRGLGAVLDSRAHVAAETEKWRKVSAFFARFERDVQLADPRIVRAVAAEAPAWLGRAQESEDPRLEFSRFSLADGLDVPRRTGYRLTANHEIELWLWPSLDIAPDRPPKRYVVLSDVSTMEIEYMNAESVWVNTWPVSRVDAAIPKAVRLRLVLGSKEELVRVFMLQV